MFCLQFSERFETFVILFRHAHVTHGTISHLFADSLFASKIDCLMFFETRATSKASVTGLARDSFFSERTRRNRLAVTTRLSALVRCATFTALVTATAYILSSHRTRNTVYHVKMSIYGVIHQVNSFFVFYLSVEYYVCAI